MTLSNPYNAQLPPLGACFFRKKQKGSHNKPIKKEIKGLCLFVASTIFMPLFLRKEINSK